MFLFDTDVISNIIKKKPSQNLIDKLSELSPDKQFTTSITVAELVYGAYKSGRPKYFMEKLESLVWPNVNILPFDESAGRTYGKLRADLEKNGVTVSEPDLRIVSVALSKGLTLVTGNIQHFNKVPGLPLENWIG